MNYYPKDVLKIPHATPETTDAAQYMFRKGRKQYSLCGEFCVAYLMQDEAYTDNIDDFLDYWEVKDLTLYQSLFKNGLARTTGVTDLQRLLSDYGVTGTFPRFADIPMQPNWMEGMIATGAKAIVGVQIDNYGYLVGKGIPHWVVLTDVWTLDKYHALCDVYNPFTNSMEFYSWRELMTSTGAYKQGFWVRDSG